MLGSSLHAGAFNSLNYFRGRVAKVDLEVDPHAMLARSVAAAAKHSHLGLHEHGIGIMMVSQLRVSIAVCRQRISLTRPS